MVKVSVSFIVTVTVLEHPVKENSEHNQKEESREA